MQALINHKQHHAEIFMIGYCCARIFGELTISNYDKQIRIKFKWNIKSIKSSY